MQKSVQPRQMDFVQCEQAGSSQLSSTAIEFAEIQIYVADQVVLKMATPTGGKPDNTQCLQSLLAVTRALEICKHKRLVSLSPSW